MSKKKNFLETANNRQESNPAMNFISDESVEAIEGKLEQENQSHITTIEKPPKGYKFNPLYVEVKSKRVQLVLQPSLYERVKAASVTAGLSLNEYCHRVLDEATKSNDE